MIKKISGEKIFAIWGFLILFSFAVCAEGKICNPRKCRTDSSSWSYTNEAIPLSPPETDSLLLSAHPIHRISIEGRPAYVFPTKPFFSDENDVPQHLKSSYSTHLRYSFSFYPNTYNDIIYNGTYQGIGLAYYTFNNRKEFGSPVALYLFQGARITSLSRCLSLNYEWNFGMSFGWKPYDFDTNPGNKIIGSKINAYINVNFYFSWMLSDRININSGLTLTHFSNGNTKYPNAGLNTAGIKAGVTYKFERKHTPEIPKFRQSHIPIFPRHISYDLVLFGSWRRTGVDYQDIQIASPEAYTVLGFGFAPMYNVGYKLRLGASLDGIYDGSANVYTNENELNWVEFLDPPRNKQFALGISAHAEYIMPYFTVNIGIGDNFLYGKGDLNACYQTLALKIEATRSSFIHIGYSLKDFHEPNFLMLGIGMRLNNKYPVFYRK